MNDPVSVIESLTYLHSADLAPDARRCAWATTRVVDGTDVLELTVHDLLSGTGSVVGRGSSPVWAPDGERVAYTTEDEAGATQLHLWSAGTDTAGTAPVGTVQQLTSLPQGVAGGAAWSPDGRLLAFGAFPEPRDRTLPYRITRVVGWRDGAGLVDDSATDIWVHDVAAGQSRRLTADEAVNGSPTWLAQTGEIAFVASWRPDDWNDVSVVRAVSVEGAVRDILTVRDVTGIADVPASVGQLALGVGGSFRDTPGELVVLGHDGSLHSRTSELGIDANGDIFGDMPVPFADPAARILVSGETAIVSVQDQDRLTVHRIALRGEQSGTVVASSDNCLYPLALADRTLLLADGTLVAAPDLWTLDLGSDKGGGGTRRRLTTTADDNAAVLRPVVVERFWAQTEGGPPVQCKLLRPSGVDGPLPTVLVVHGGPYTTFGEAFVTDAQLLCEAGYAALLVNPRGSRGYGPAFSAAIEGDWGNHDYRDLMAAVDHAVAAGWADPDRLGVSGLSYGGFMTAWIIAHTHRFKAAVYENGVSNFVSMYGTSDIGLSYLPEALRRPPFEDLDTYLRCSPVTTAHTAVTPTLVIVGDQDHRCPPEQGLQLYSVLRRAGCTAELLVLPGASHGGSVDGSVVVRRAQNEALLDWMQRFV